MSVTLTFTYTQQKYVCLHKLTHLVTGLLWTGNAYSTDFLEATWLQ